MEKAERVTVFGSGKEGYHTFRIPAIVTTKTGTLLAFAEGRVHGTADFGDVDIVLKRSPDSGATWGPLQVVQDDGTWQCGNPCPVVDRDTGRILLLTTGARHAETEVIKGKGTREVYLSYSDDDGLTWSERRNISALVKKPDWRWYATGPCSGIQVRSGKYKGRLVIPANHSHHMEGEKWEFRCHALYSDDQGETWNIGASSEPGGSETQIAELADDVLIQDIRMQSHRKGLRAVRYSRDGGATWTPLAHDPNRICPRCQGSLISVPADTGPLLVASNPNAKNRTNMTVRFSPDGGKSWPHAVVLEPGPSAYSGLVVLDRKTVGCFFETGIRGPYEKLVFVKVPVPGSGALYNRQDKAGSGGRQK